VQATCRRLVGSRRVPTYPFVGVNRASCSRRGQYLSASLSNPSLARGEHGRLYRHTSSFTISSYRRLRTPTQNHSGQRYANARNPRSADPLADATAPSGHTRVPLAQDGGMQVSDSRVQTVGHGRDSHLDLQHIVGVVEYGVHRMRGVTVSTAHHRRPGPAFRVTRGGRRQARHAIFTSGLAVAHAGACVGRGPPRDFTPPIVLTEISSVVNNAALVNC
jgi:hypothetical protein